MSRLLAFATVAAACVLVSASSAATPGIRSKEADAQAIVAQVQALSEEVNLAAERFNGANYRLSQLSAQLSETTRELRRVRVGSRKAERRYANRIVDIYTSEGSASALEIIFGAESLDDMLERLETSERIAEQDRELLVEYRAFRAELTRRQDELRRARAEQEQVVRDREAERSAIAAKLAERERLLGSVRQEIARLKERERARQAELQRQTRAVVAARRAAASRSTASEGIEPQSMDPPDAPESPESSAPPPAAPPADASRGAQVVAIAMRYLGVPYRWGGASSSAGFDCSGLTMYVYAQIGISLPHFAAAQYGHGRAVSRDDLALGDLVFARGLGHMGMYVGGGNYIHAPQTGDVVKITSMSSRSDWVGFRRIL